MKNITTWFSERIYELYQLIEKRIQEIIDLNDHQSQIKAKNEESDIYSS